MIQLSDEQLNNLGKEALVVIVSSLQDQLLALQSQLDHANAQLSEITARSNCSQNRSAS